MIFRIALALSVLFLAACSNPCRNVYEGVRTHQEGMQTPTERSTSTPAPSYDRYRKERDESQPAAGSSTY